MRRWFRGAALLLCLLCALPLLAGFGVRHAPPSGHATFCRCRHCPGEKRCCCSPDGFVLGTACESTPVVALPGTAPRLAPAPPLVLIAPTTLAIVPRWREGTSPSAATATTPPVPPPRVA